ncbi:MAG: FIST C-terminal domain-containing protein [Scytolyngbya sp. HA4215-MV1]|jgi:small ligand-binding sensory domain FIST|nr:FIST C-terminal domain-containing protein [Scytolyngbya sp. HA4215-MV1]
MQWACALSTRPSLEAAVAEVVEQAKQSLQQPPDLGLVFISSAFASEFSRLLPLLQERLPGLTLIGCGGGGIIGADRDSQSKEIEGSPALSLSLAVLPGVKIRAFHLTAEDLPDLDSPPDAWIDLIGVPVAEQPQFILLADGFSARVNDFLQGLDFAYPSSVKVGGLASSGTSSSQIGLFCNDRLYREGTVGLALSGNIVLETIVAQGCRPIGHPYRVIEAERNIVLGLEAQPDSPAGYGGSTVLQQSKRTPLEILQELIQDLSEEDRLLAQHSLFVGVAQSEFKQTLEHGDFLIRQLLGVDPRVGAIAIGDRIRAGQRIQFHLRDAKTSAEDLEVLLQRYQQQQRNHSAQGALLFSCMGRGEGLYGEPHFDSRLFQRYVNQIPIGGFFCNGEIGPVGKNTFLHGYTSVFGICRQP